MRRTSAKAIRRERTRRIPEDVRSKPLKHFFSGTVRTLRPSPPPPLFQLSPEMIRIEIISFGGIVLLVQLALVEDIDKFFQEDSRDYVDSAPKPEW